MFPFSFWGIESFVPTDLSGLIYWVDANDTTTINTGTPVDMDQVNSLSDLSVSGYTATQVTSTRQPLWRSSGFGSNSKAYLDFDGVDDYLYLGTQIGKQSEYTVFAVFDHDTNNSICVIGDLRSSGVSTSSSMHMRVEGGVFRNQFSDGANTSFINSTEAAVFNTPYIFESKYTTGNIVTEMIANGTALTENQIGGSPASSIGGTSFGMSIGRLGDFNGRYLNGKVAEIIYYNRPLSVSESTQVRNYLNNKYSAF